MSTLKWADNDSYKQGLLKSNVALLIYGANRGLVLERADSMKQIILGDGVGDAFRDFVLSREVLEESPAALAEEAATISFTGLQKFIHVKNPPKEASDFMGEFLDSPTGDCFILVTCEELGTKDSWRTLFENASNAGACACYIADESRGQISAKLRAETIAIDSDALQFLTVQLRGQDNGIIDMEVEKLCLYAGESKKLSLDDVSLVCGSSSDIGIDVLTLSCLAGRSLEDLDKDLAGMYKRGVVEVHIIRTLVRNLRKLADLKRKLAEGIDFKAAARSLRIFFKLENDFKRACSIWSADDIYALVTRVQMCELQCKSGFGFEQLILARTLQRISAQALHLSHRSRSHAFT